MISSSLPAVGTRRNHCDYKRARTTTETSRENTGIRFLLSTRPIKATPHAHANTRPPPTAVTTHKLRRTVPTSAPRKRTGEDPMQSFGDWGDKTETVNMSGVVGSGTAALAGRAFECKTCNRRFLTFQALGGHRTGHRNPKPTGHALGCSHIKPKVHGCSICGLEFPLGQALGGHMRRHRGNVEVVPAASRRRCTEKKASPPADGHLWLDLNQPPVEDDDDEELLTLELGIGFA